MVDWLLRNKANLNAHSDHGRTLMSEAASGVRPDKDEDNARYQAIIRRLERAGVELDVFAAIACNDVPRVAHILRGNVQAGAQRTRAGLPAIHLAVILDRREIVKLLLDAGCDPNFRSQSESIGYKGETPLSQAACWGRFEIAEVLIKHNADVNARAERGVAPLHEAAYAEQLEVAHLLLEHGAEVNARDQQGHTPLSWRDDRAASAEMIELLRRYGGVK
jgi:hypothetical protein